MDNNKKRISDLQKKILNNLTQLGYSQKRFADDIVADFNVSGFSTGYISQLLNPNNRFKEKTQIIKLNKLLKLSEKMLAKPENYNSKHSNSFTVHYDKRDRAIGKNFIKNNLLNSKVTMNKIDVLGIKNSDVRHFLEDSLDSSLPKMALRILFLDNDGVGMEQRIIFEGRTLELAVRNNIFRHAWEEMILLKERLESLKNGSTISLKKYNFLPSIKLLRVNDTILFCNYLNGKGYTSFYFTCKKADNPNLFKKYQEYFDFIFNNEKLSQPLSLSIE